MVKFSCDLFIFYLVTLTIVRLTTDDMGDGALTRRDHATIQSTTIQWQPRICSGVLILLVQQII